jgi:transposase-like protein
VAREGHDVSNKREAMLVRRIEAEQRRGATGRRGYSLKLRQLVLEHVASSARSGDGTTRVARRLGLRPETIGRWQRWEEGKTTSTFHAITVVEDASPQPVAVELGRTVGISLRTPCGVVVGGLSANDLVTILRGLR